MQSSSETSALATDQAQDASLLVDGLVERYKDDGRAMYSVESKAALVNRVNANLLRKWIWRSQRAASVGTSKALLPVLVKPASLRAHSGRAEVAHGEVVEVMLARGSLRLAASTTNLERLVGLLAR